MLTVLIAAGIAAVGAFADWGTTSTSYSVYNDGGGKVQVWSCTDDTCSLRNEAGTAEPGEAVPAEFAAAGDLFLVSDETGEVLGCLTLPSATTDYVGVTVDVSDAEDCPPGAPTSVG